MRQVWSPPATTLTRERLGGGPIAAATDKDGGNMGAGAEARDRGVSRGGLVGGGDGRFVSSSTPTGASVASEPLDVVSALGGAIAVATERESGSAPGPIAASSESNIAVWTAAGRATSPGAVTRAAGLVGTTFAGPSERPSTTVATKPSATTPMNAAAPSAI